MILGIDTGQLANEGLEVKIGLRFLFLSFNSLLVRVNIRPSK